MKYLLYDFTRDSSKPINEMVMPSWARITLDMDPDAGLVVINDNSRFWGRSWLFDLNTGKRKWISTSPAIRFSPQPCPCIDAVWYARGVGECRGVDLAMVHAFLPRSKSGYRVVDNCYTMGMGATRR